MSDFQEVMRQRNRMCEKYYGHCGDCPLNAFKLCAHPQDGVLPAYEAVILGWAAKNPEPQYPTWGEWFSDNFPNGKLTNFCPSVFDKDMIDCANYPHCDGCHDCSIPAEIAIKLGIKPKETKE